MQRTFTEPTQSLNSTCTEPTTQPKQYLRNTYTGPTQNSHRNCEGLEPNMYRYYSDNTQHLQITQQELRRTYAETTHWDAPTYWHCLPGAPRVLQFKQNVNRDSACARARGVKSSTPLSTFGYARLAFIPSLQVLKASGILEKTEKCLNSSF